MTDLLSDVLRASVDGICAFDAQHRCTLWSPAMEQLTGVGAQAALGRTQAELLPEQQQQPFALAFSATHEGGVLGVARKTEAGITELLSVASHKLKTPLTALQIHLGAQLRAVQAREPSRAWLEKSTAAAIEQSMRLADTIDLLVDVSRIDSGRWRLERAEVELGGLLCSTIERLRYTAQDAGCEVLLKLDGEVRGVWDAHRLEEVLATLLGNAFKHGAGHPVEVQLDARADVGVLQLTDHGRGMSPDEVARLFVRSPRSPFGLWLSQQIVHAHQGTLTAQSGEGGSTFTLTLPRSPPLGHV